MLKVGDKVKVTYTNGDQFLGRIVGETAKQWKIDFDGEEERRINKSMKIELVDDPKTPEKEVISVVPDESTEKLRRRKRSSSNTLSGKEWAIVGATLLLAAFAICVGLGYIEIGEAGIHFNF